MRFHQHRGGSPFTSLQLMALSSSEAPWSGVRTARRRARRARRRASRTSPPSSTLRGRAGPCVRLHLRVRRESDFIPDLCGRRDARGVKLVPKKSWEITNNLLGSTPAREPRSLRIDDQPLLCVHLIDGDPETCWSSRAQIEADFEPVWIRIDLPVEPRSVRSGSCRRRKECAASRRYPASDGYPRHRQGLPARSR